MELRTVYTKTAKGVTQVNQKTQSLSRDLMKVLKFVDGKSTLEQIAQQNEIPAAALDKSMQQLKKEGFIKVFEVKIETPLSDFGGASDDDDFDFTKSAKPAPLADLMPTFGPSKYRSPLAMGQVEHALPVTPAPPPKPVVDEAAQLALRAAAEATALQAREAAARAQAEARARAEREAELRARLEVEARARKEAEARAQVEAKAAQEASARARAELEARVEAERKQQAALSDTRNRLTQEQIKKEEAQQKELAAARARAEAEAQAFAQARAKAEAAVKSLGIARAEAEAASARQQEEFAIAQRDLRTQLKAEIEAKVRAEMEVLLKADIDEGAREEVEAAVREEAQEEARRMLEEQLVTERASLARAEASAKERAEVDVKRMLADQEAKMRAEMDAKLAEMAAEKAKIEEGSRQMVAAQAAAAAKAETELAARLKTEAAARLVAEAEAARVKKSEAEAAQAATAAAAAASAATAAAAAMAIRLKSEEEARRAAERDAAALAEIDVQNRIKMEARLREEAAARATAEAEMNARLATEKQAKYEAEARALIEQEMREAAQKESSAKLEDSERARAEAEKKAAMEAKGRALASRSAADQVEQRKRIERESEEALQRERGLREKAEEKGRLEEEAEERARAAQVARLKELQEDSIERAAVADAKPMAKRRRSSGGGGLLRWVGLAGFLLIGLVLGAVQFVPLGGINTRMLAALSGWLHDDVAVGSMRIGLMPKPHVKLEQVSVGKSLDAQAAGGKLFMSMGSLFGDKFDVNTVELSDIKISADALSRAVKWAETEGRGKDIKIDRISLKNVTAEVRGADLGLFDADIFYDKAGKMTRVTAASRAGKWNFEAAPDKASDATLADVPWLVDVSARSLALPVGVPIPILDLKAKGTIIGKELNLPEIEARLLSGSATAKLRADWKQHIAIQAEVTTKNVDIGDLTGVFTRDIALGGKMDGTFTIAATSPAIGQLLDRPQVSGNFDVKDGSIGNADLVQAMRSPDSAGRGGQTKFGELVGQLRAGDGVIRFERLRLVGGVLLANGGVTLNNGSGALGGSVSAEIRSSVAQDRGTFGVSGTVARPVLKRGG